MIRNTSVRIVGDSSAYYGNSQMCRSLWHYSNPVTVRKGEWDSLTLHMHGIHRETQTATQLWAKVASSNVSSLCVQQQVSSCLIVLSGKCVCVCCERVLCMILNGWHVMCYVRGWWVVSMAVLWRWVMLCEEGRVTETGNDGMWWSVSYGNWWCGDRWNLTYLCPTAGIVMFHCSLWKVCVAKMYVL